MALTIPLLRYANFLMTLTARTNRSSFSLGTHHLALFSFQPLMMLSGEYVQGFELPGLLPSYSWTPKGEC